MIHPLRQVNSQAASVGRLGAMTTSEDPIVRTQRLIKAHDEMLTAAVGFLQGVPVTVEGKPAQITVLALVARIIQIGCALQELMERGYGDEAAPLARSMVTGVANAQARGQAPRTALNMTPVRCVSRSASMDSWSLCIRSPSMKQKFRDLLDDPDMPTSRIWLSVLRDLSTSFFHEHLTNLMGGRFMTRIPLPGGALRVAFVVVLIGATPARDGRCGLLPWTLAGPPVSAR
jgi:hypothetical protein